MNRLAGFQTDGFFLDLTGPRSIIRLFRMESAQKTRFVVNARNVKMGVKK